MILVSALITDLTQNKIPNQLIVFGLLLGFMMQCFSESGIGGFGWLFGVVIGFAGFLPLYLLKGLAAGDVKLMMVVGGFLGCPLIVHALIYTMIAGGVLAFVFSLYKGRFTRLLKNLYGMIATFVTVTVYPGFAAKETASTIKQSAGKMPYASAIIVGTVLTLYFSKTGQGFI